MDKYERLLSCELKGDSNSINLASQPNEIEQKNVVQRQHQMSQIISNGLKRIEDEARIKQSVEDTMMPLSSAKRIIDTAVLASPIAGVAWAGVCCALQVPCLSCSIRTNYRC